MSSTETVLLSGTSPGALDSSQPSRLLRHPGSALLFASYDPLTACADQAHSGFTGMPRSTSKRIVVETSPDGHSSWRWVPNARKEDDVADEGDFSNRAVEICGTLYRMSQPQWDIYKLDPIYECYVRRWPAPPIISRKVAATESGTTAPGVTVPDAEQAPSTFFGEDAEDAMNFDTEEATPSTTSTLPKRQSENSSAGPTACANEARFKRARDHSPGANNQFGDRPQFEDVERNTKYYAQNEQKRTRTLSPNSVLRNLKHNKSERANAKARKLDDQKYWRNQQYHSLNNDIPVFTPPLPNDEDVNPHEFVYSSNEANDAHAAHAETGQSNVNEPCEFPDISESIRKLAEMNLNRPAERERERVSTADPLSSQKNTKTSSSAGTGCHGSSTMPDESHRKEEAHRQLEEERRRRTMLSKAEKDREARNAEWSMHSWDHHAALARYEKQALFFDKAKFTLCENPLTPVDIPWPTLAHPLMLRPEDLEYIAIAEFLGVAKKRLTPAEFSSLVAKGRLRFHPDRWSNRRLLEAMPISNDDRITLKNIIITISQAMNGAYEANERGI